MAVDHFSKWTEAEAVNTITPEKMIDFVQNHIITRFGIPKKIVSDNGTQFASKKFVEYCNRLKIENGFTSVAHPQANGQTEVMNRTIVLRLKKRLLEKKGNWPDELINVLWAHRTTPCRSTGETPFSLVYGVEAVIPVDIGAPSSRIQFYSEKDNNINLKYHLDDLEERRERANILMAAYKAKVARYHNRRVRQIRLQLVILHSKIPMRLKAKREKASLEPIGKDHIWFLKS